MLTFDWYRWIWTRIGGRPWTYIIRDWYHQEPVVAMFVVAWLVMGLDKMKWVGYEVFLWITIGVLVGHLFWGTPYIKNQQGTKKGGITIEKVKK